MNVIQGALYLDRFVDCAMKKKKTSLRWPVLGKISQEEFLRKYWQKRPLLMKQALVPFPDVITPEEVGGLSCDERVESRLIIEKGGRRPWELRRGPFKPAMFKKLPKTHWTVLVNGVDRFIPRMNAFLDHFSFVPFWRMDDIMVSYADDRGNVGAHVDNFDVFLVQAAGKREWMIEDRPVLRDDFVPDLPVRLLKKFKPTHRWVLEPGDILYLPPRFPHHGVARGKGCMTISVGFRAPTTEEILNSVVSAALARTAEGHRYTDPDLQPCAPGEIPPAAIHKMADIVRSAAASEDIIADWLGRFTTEPYGDVNLEETANAIAPAKVSREVKTASFVVRAEGSRLAYIRTGRSSVSFFVNGVRQELSGKAAACAALLADHVVTPVAEIAALLGDRKVQKLLSELLGSGAIVLEE